MFSGGLSSAMCRSRASWGSGPASSVGAGTSSPIRSAAWRASSSAVRFVASTAMSMLPSCGSPAEAGIADGAGGLCSRSASVSTDRIVYRRSCSPAPAKTGSTGSVSGSPSSQRVSRRCSPGTRPETVRSGATATSRDTARSPVIFSPSRSSRSRRR
jgi:hypothetical protein